VARSVVGQPNGPMYVTGCVDMGKPADDIAGEITLFVKMPFEDLSVISRFTVTIGLGDRPRLLSICT
jgi:hypothetical protein